MGMVLVMRRVDGPQLAALHADPESVPEFVIEDEVAFASGDLIDFDKAWHALHFLFTGQADENNKPLSLLRLDADTLGEDMGYGAPQVLSPTAMRQFNEAISAVSDDQLRSRYDPAAMARANVYLGESLAEEGDEMWEYVAQGLPALRALAARCVATDTGAIVVIT